jgi:ribonuclease BN (tRNA processing enzyme)
MGFPFFGPAYVPGVRINIYGVHPGLRDRFESQMDRIDFPITLREMSADIVFHQLQPDGETVIGPFTITNKGLHHPGGSYAYRIEADGKSLVFATDGEYKEPMEEFFPPFIDFFRGADTLVFDAMYASIEKTIEKENFGHSTAVIGIELARRAGVKRLVLFHHDHEAGDDQIAHAYAEALAYLHYVGANGLELAISWDGLVLDI